MLTKLSIGIKNRSSYHGSVLRNPTQLVSMRMRVQSLASISGLRIWHCCSCGVGCRCSLDPVLLWLWRRPVATAPIGPLAWEPPYASGAAQENGKKTKRQKKKKFAWKDTGFGASLVTASISHAKFPLLPLLIRVFQGAPAVAQWKRTWPAATAPIRPLAWEFQYAECGPKKDQKKKKDGERVFQES